MRTFLIAASLLFPLAASAKPCAFAANRDFQVDAAGLRMLAIYLGASDVRAEGVAGLAHIEVHGKACASQQGWVADLDIRQRRENDRFILTGARPPGLDQLVMCPMAGSDQSQPACYAYIDITVRMPSHLPLEIHSAGDAVANNLAALDFRDGYGDLMANHIAGALLLKVGAGAVKADDVGSIDLQSDDTGAVTATQVRGDIQVGEVDSGKLEFTNVDGNVIVDKIDSGKIVANHVKGDISITTLGSGDIHVDNVGGNFSVSVQGTGEIHQKNVGGRVNIPHERDR